MTDVVRRLGTALADRYRVERELGSSGMATVYLAHDLKHERDVALQVLHPELAAVLGAERFLSEIKTTAKLQHPHILPLLDSGDADGLLFYVMPVVDGESLRQRLQRDTQLPLDDAIRITKEVGSALDYAHRQGVIHRDIKPENILMHDGSAMVTDFGIALAVTAAGGARLTQTGLSLGTPQYMSPEQAMGERQVDARADVYALGCVLYEMLAGAAPFTGPTAQAIVAQVLTTEPLPVTTHRKTVPPAVARAVHRALQKLAADRWASIALFTSAMDDTRAAAAMQNAAMQNASMIDGQPGAPRANRVRTWGLVAAALVVGTGIGAAVFARQSTSVSADAAPRYYQIALPDTAPFIAGVNGFDAALTSLALTGDGRTLAYVAETPAGQRIALVRLDRGTRTVLIGTDGGYLPTFSPDGQSIAFVSGTSLKKIAIADGTVTTLANVAPSSFGVVWATDGRIYVGGYAGKSSLVAIPEAGGVPVRVPTDRSDVRRLTAVDETGAQLIGQTQTGETLVIDTRTGRSTVVPNVDGASGLTVASPERLLLFRDSSLLAARLDVAGARLVGPMTSILTNVRREAWTGQAHAALSKEGTLVWASGGDASVAQFVWLDVKGVLRDTALRVSAVVSSYALSPDANRIAYSVIDGAGRVTLRVADLRRQVTDEVPFEGSLEPREWIRDGRALTAMLSRPNLPGKQVLVDFSGASVRVDTTTGVGDESRDGTMRCIDRRDTLLLSRTTHPATQVVVDPAGGFWCRFSPDGARVVYLTDAGMFVASTSGRVVDSRVQVAPAGADEGRWSEDGQTIYYRNANGWYRVDAPTADMRPGGPPKLLFTGRYLQAWASWDRARDGRYLMLQGAPPVRLRTLNVMTNFPTLLEEKLKAAK